MRINWLCKPIQIIDPDRKPVLFAGKIFEELPLAHTGNVSELLPEMVGMPFHDLGGAETADDLLHRGCCVDVSDFCRTVLEDLLAELVLFGAVHDCLDIFRLNGQ